MLDQIGRYRIIKPLGEGAMASVYLAELETEIGFRRKVALKVVRQEFAKDHKFIALMSREAMIGSLLQHPNIVQTLEFNEADGRCFLALEFVEGQTLEDVLKKNSQGDGGLPVRLALEAMVQVLKGLSYAHTLKSPEGEELGIVHRDLKPGNIMLSRHGLVKVMDFGIAKARIASANITTAGQVRGTPIYMAPEQVTGKPLDGRTDQFAAATVLYELLTGNQMFIANNLVRIMQRVARAQVGEQLQEIAEIHPLVPDVMEKMWAKKPDDRYEDCDEPAALLEDIVFDLKSRERAMRASGGATSEVAASSEASPAEESTLLGTVGSLVRRVFGGDGDKTPVPAAKRKKKRKRKRKRKRRRQAAPTRLSTPAAKVPDQIGPPAAVATDDIQFDQNVSDFAADPVASREAQARRSGSVENISAAATRTAPRIPEQPADLPDEEEDTLDPRETAATPVDPLPAQRDPEDSGEDLDPFFYRDFDD